LDSISFEYSPLWIVPIVLLGAALATLLYRLFPGNKDYPKAGRYALAVLRATVLIILGLLLLSPFIKSTLQDIKKPMILIARDNSESIPATMDSLQIKDYLEKLEDLEKKLKENYEVENITFSNKAESGKSISLDGKTTNIASVFEYAYNNLGADNLSAIILASDGIYNDGADPAFELQKIKVPVYSILLGDTTVRKDLKIRKIFYNKIAYLNDKFTVQVDISAQNCQGSQTNLTVLGNNGERLEQIPLTIDQTDYFKTLEITLTANRSGVQRFRFELGTLPGEFSTSNNKREIFVEVLDGRQNILILANSPHPDIAAITQILENNLNYKVETALAQNFKGDLRQYDQVIFHQLPSRQFNAQSWINTLQQAKKPILFVVGNQTDLNTFNRVQSTLSIMTGSSSTNEVQGIIHQNFGLFTLSEELRKSLPDFAPVTVPFGEFKPGPGAEVLLYQRIGKIDTSYPLLTFQNSDQGKVAVFAGEGIWKWRLFDFMQHQNFEIVDELIQKTISYLSVKEDKRRFRSFPSKNIFDENEPVIISAELYNESYEMINDPDVSLILINEDGKEFKYTMNRRAKAYIIEPGLFPVGNYRMKASTTYNNENFQTDGRFSIQPIEIEGYELTANHGLMNRLADLFGGKSVYPTDISVLLEEVQSNERVKPVIYESVKTHAAINLKWLFFLLITFLGLEWFFRKFFGSY